MGMGVYIPKTLQQTQMANTQKDLANSQKAVIELANGSNDCTKVAPVFAKMVRLKQISFNDIEEKYKQSVAEQLGITPKYCYYNYGNSFKLVDDTYTAKIGEKVFKNSYSDAQLKIAFPATAGSITYTVETNAVAGDTVTICGNKLTAGTDFEVGTDTKITAANITNAFKSSIYKAVCTGNTITVSEIIYGDDNIPTNASFTGTIVISNSEVINSVKGYSTVKFYIDLDNLTTAYSEQQEQLARAFYLLTADGNDTTENRQELADLKSWLASSKEELINEQ